MKTNLVLSFIFLLRETSAYYCVEKGEEVEGQVEILFNYESKSES